MNTFNRLGVPRPTLSSVSPGSPGYQLHDHIAREILEQDPHATNYFGSKAAGDFLWLIMEIGASGDWRAILRDKLGGSLSARAMLDYFQPLMDWLQEQNQGREHTLPEL